MLLVTPEQQGWFGVGFFFFFLQEHDVLKVMVCFYEARRETFRPRLRICCLDTYLTKIGTL